MLYEIAMLFNKYTVCLYFHACHFPRISVKLKVARFLGVPTRLYKRFHVCRPLNEIIGTKCYLRNTTGRSTVHTALCTTVASKHGRSINIFNFCFLKKARAELLYSLCN